MLRDWAQHLKCGRWLSLSAPSVGLRCTPERCTLVCVIDRVVLSRLARRQLAKSPRHIAQKLLAWIDQVESEGLEETRKTPGFHDEVLRGQRSGQRSIRLSRSYRAIYVLKEDGELEFVSVEEVSKHDY